MVQFLRLILLFWFVLNKSTATLYEEMTLQENTPIGSLIVNIESLPSVLTATQQANASVSNCSMTEQSMPLYSLSNCSLYVHNSDFEYLCPITPSYESNCTISISIKLIMDNGTADIERMVEINSTLENVNEAPVFSINGGRDLYLTNSVPYGVPFLTGQATDPDRRTSNTEVHFGMDGGNGKFGIDKVPLNTPRIRMTMYSDSFYLSRTGQLNATEQSKYTLILKAWDNGNPSKTGYATVTITVPKW